MKVYVVVSYECDDVGNEFNDLKHVFFDEKGAKQLCKVLGEDYGYIEKEVLETTKITKNKIIYFSITKYRGEDKRYDGKIEIEHRIKTTTQYCDDDMGKDVNAQWSKFRGYDNEYEYEFELYDYILDTNITDREIIKKYKSGMLKIFDIICPMMEEKHKKTGKTKSQFDGRDYEIDCAIAKEINKYFEFTEWSKKYDTIK